MLNTLYHKPKMKMKLDLSRSENYFEITIEIMVRLLTNPKIWYYENVNIWKLSTFCDLIT